MKYSICLFFISISCFFVSCKQIDAVPYCGIEFLFKEPQPIQERNLNYFPNKFRGSFINQDSTYLIIEDKVVYYKWLDKNNLSFSEFESLKDSMTVSGNKLYYGNQYIEYRKLKDSIEIMDSRYDTLFSFTNSNKAKKVKNSLVLNFKDSIYWKIKVLTFDTTKVSIMDFYSEEDLRRLDSLTVTKSQKIDSIRNVFHLSKSEFKKMLHLKKLGFIQDFKRLN